MNRHVNAISSRLSLRPPQRESLEILDWIVEIARPSKDLDVATALAAICSEYPSVADFEREFPSVCFATYSREFPSSPSTRRKSSRVTITNPAKVSECRKGPPAGDDRDRPYQHLQYLENQFRGAGRKGTTDQADERVRRRQLLGLELTATPFVETSKGAIAFKNVIYDYPLAKAMADMLKEGWDVTNLYTIIPLRAANARILIEQSIGRGLRLPYGKRTGISSVDRLNIIAHDRFQEIIDEANKPSSAIRLQQLVLDPATDLQKTVAVVAGASILDKLGVASLTLATSSINYQPVERDILIQHLRTQKQETLTVAAGGMEENRLEDHLVRVLIDFDDICYDHADLLYDLAEQMVEHLRSYLDGEEDIRNVLLYYQRPLAEFIHAQMLEHHWEKVAGYDVEVRKGFSELKSCAFTATAENAIHDFRETVADKSRIAQLVFGGFQRCLYPAQKFQSDTERKLSIILDRESEKWFKPALGQFQIFYTSGRDQKEYQPDFVAETTDAIYMHKPKARNEMTDQEVLAKRDAAVQWCHYATQHALANGGKAWHYLLTRIIHVGCVKSALSMWCVAQVISLAAQSVLRETIDLPT